MKQISFLLICILLIGFASGCTQEKSADIAATTLPVYTFTQQLCQGTDLTVSRLVTEQVSCLHDYSLQVRQMRTISSAKVLVQSGAGLEDFLSNALSSFQGTLIDASEGIPLLESNCSHDHEQTHAHAHHHEMDSHIWLSPVLAKEMANNICAGLTAVYPSYEKIFVQNLQGLLQQLDDLQAYGEETLQNLSCRQLITFHDGFAYFADAFDLTILAAVEEESGSEASAQLLKELIRLVGEHQLPAVFTERNGSTAAANVIVRETAIQSFSLDMAMSGESYFDAMYSNINTIKEALG